MIAGNAGSPGSGPTFRAAAVTHRGRVRERNEDAICIDGRLLAGDMTIAHAHTLLPCFHVALLADGMGGHASGEIASAAALGHLATGWERRRDVHGWSCALQAANDRIYDLMAERPSLNGMGTTVVGIAFGKNTLIHFNVGDSRAYKLAFGSLVQISRDDTPLHPSGPAARRSHMITQSLGGHASRTVVRPHVGGADPLASGEVLLLCSDGLTDMVSDDNLRAVMVAYEDPEECVGKLLETALLAGGHDNISIIIVRAL